MTPKVKVFISYAHEDEVVKENLDKFLIGLKKSEKIEVWNDRQISAGTEWDKKIKEELQNADLIILIVSVDFLNSIYIERTELEIAMQRHERNEARVIPIIARSIDWSETPFRKLQGLPGDRKTISDFTDKDKVYTDISKEIKRVVDELMEIKINRKMVFDDKGQSGKPQIFFSVATPHSTIQLNYINNLREKFLSRGFELSTVSNWNDEAPLDPIFALMGKCVGCIVLLLERYYIEEGKIKRGSESEMPMKGLALTSPWNHIEATLAFSQNLPKLILKDKNVFNDGVFVDHVKQFKQVKIDIGHFDEWKEDDKSYIFEDFIDKVKAFKR